MHTERALQFRPAQVRSWAALLLCASLFSALHGVLGPWWWPEPQGAGQWTEVCSSLGRQWVWQASDSEEVNAVPSPGGAMVPSWAPPCAWAMAHQALPPSSIAPPSVTAWRFMVLTGRWVSGHLLGPPPDRADRVLLMAPMRAPPLLIV